MKEVIVYKNKIKNMDDGDMHSWDEWDCPSCQSTNMSDSDATTHNHCYECGAKFIWTDYVPTNDEIINQLQEDIIKANAKYQELYSDMAYIFSMQGKEVDPSDDEYIKYTTIKSKWSMIFNTERMMWAGNPTQTSNFSYGALMNLLNKETTK